jgi:hypothetical protein
MNLELQKIVLSIVAFTLGYFIFWFVYGIEILSLLIVILIAAAAAAFVQKRLAGIGQFFALLLSLMVLGGFLWGLFVLPIAFSNGETLFIVPFLVAPMVLVAVVVVALWKQLPRWIRFATASPFAPWMFFIGVLTFGFFPATRVDCRNLQYNDSFMNYGSGFTGAGGTKNYWERKPNLIVDLAELPTGFKPDVVRAVATSCFYNQDFHPRVFSFQASHPIILVHLIVLKNLRVRQSYGALFTPISHKKLTPWLEVEAPYPYGANTPPSPYETYPILGSTIYPYLPLPPRVFLNALKK